MKSIVQLLRTSGRLSLILLVLGVYLFSSLAQPIASASPLSPEEQKAVLRYPNWVASNCASDDISSTSVTAGTGEPTGATFPNLDPNGMAQAIDAFVKKNGGGGPMENLGATIVASAKKSNVNPFLVPTIALMETSLGLANTPQVTQGNDLFNRRATSSQPNISISTGLWYKWTSVKASVDSTAPENSGESGGGDFLSYMRVQYPDALKSGDLLELFTAYAPPGDGNDTTGYTDNVKGWIDELVKLTSSTSGNPTGSTTTDSIDGGSACCGGSSTETTSLDGETTEPPDAVQQVVWDTLTGGGVDEIHTAAAMGNIAHEGVWDPMNASENPSSPSRSKDPSVTGSGYGYGLIGWTPGTRLLDMMKEANISGKPYTAETQSAVILAAIKGKTPSQYPAEVGKHFLATKNIKDATTAFQGTSSQRGFENPQDTVSSLPDRIKSAEEFIKKFGGNGDTTSGSSSTSETCTCSSGSSSDTSGGTTTLTGKDNVEKAFNYFVGRGLSAEASAGLVGNFQQESGQGLDTHADNGSHTGIAQWDTGGRWATLVSHAKSKSPYDLAVQLDYVWFELNHGYKTVLSALKSTKSSDDATEQVMLHYEVVNDGTLGTRQTNAKKVLAQYGDGATGAISKNCGGTAGENGWDIKGPNAMVVFDQCDPKWGAKPYGAGKTSICGSGCGITSLAMIVDTLAGKNETPLTLANRYGAKYHTVGTDWSLWPVAAKDFGLKEADIGTDLNKAAEVVKGGGLVLISVNPGAFTSQGHFMIIRAVNDKGEFLLADPNNAGNKQANRGDTNNTPYSADFLKTKGALLHLWSWQK